MSTFGRPREHPRLYRIESFPPDDYVQRIRFAHFSEIDRELQQFVREALRWDGKRDRETSASLSRR